MPMKDPLSLPRRRERWNKGRLIGQKRPLKPKDVWTIRVRLQLEGRKRDLAMFNLAVDSKLRGCDLVRLRIDDVCWRESSRSRDRHSEEDWPAGAVRDYRPDPCCCRRVGRRPGRSQRPIFVPKPFRGKATLVDAAICPHRPSMGGPRRAR